MTPQPREGASAVPVEAGEEYERFLRYRKKARELMRAGNEELADEYYTLAAEEWIAVETARKRREREGKTDATT